MPKAGDSKSMDPPRERIFSSRIGHCARTVVISITIIFLNVSAAMNEYDKQFIIRQAKIMTSNIKILLVMIFPPTITVGDNHGFVNSTKNIPSMPIPDKDVPFDT